MALLRRMPLWFIIWLLLPVLGAGALGVWYLAAGRHDVAAMQQADAPRPEEQPRPAAGTAPEQPPAPPPQIPAHILAMGDLDFPFLAYETFGPGRIALAAPGAGGTVSVLVAQYKDGKLQPVSDVEEPMGAVLDLTRGNLLNNGEAQAVVTTEKGFLILMGTQKYVKQEEPGLERVFIGDWDNDSRSETAFLDHQGGSRKLTFLRYDPDGKGETLGSVPVTDFPEWSAVLDRPGKPSLLMGAVRGEESLEVSYYSMDPAKGMQATARYPVHAARGQAIASFAAGDLSGRPTLAVSFKARPSFLELFDTATEGMPSRGRIYLPDDEVYVVLAGIFSGKARSELLAITPMGKWVLYGWD